MDHHDRARTATYRDPDAPKIPTTPEEWNLPLLVMQLSLALGSGIILYGFPINRTFITVTLLVFVLSGIARFVLLRRMWARYHRSRERRAAPPSTSRQNRRLAQRHARASKGRPDTP